MVQGRARSLSFGLYASGRVLESILKVSQYNRLLNANENRAEGLEVVVLKTWCFQSFEPK